MVFRENNEQEEMLVQTWLEPGTNLVLVPLIGEGDSASQKVSPEGELKFKLPRKFSFCLYKYEIQR
jgi:hypothetical protein